MSRPTSRRSPTGIAGGIEVLRAASQARRAGRGERARKKPPRRAARRHEGVRRTIESCAGIGVGADRVAIPESQGTAGSPLAEGRRAPRGGARQHHPPATGREEPRPVAARRLTTVGPRSTSVGARGVHDRSRPDPRRSADADDRSLWPRTSPWTRRSWRSCRARTGFRDGRTTSASRPSSTRPRQLFDRRGWLDDPALVPLGATAHSSECRVTSRGWALGSPTTASVGRAATRSAPEEPGAASGRLRGEPDRVGMGARTPGGPPAVGGRRSRVRHRSPVRRHGHVPGTRTSITTSAGTSRRSCCRCTAAVARHASAARSSWAST